MSELLSTYSVNEIITFILLLLVAGKEIIDIIKYYAGENNKIYNWKKKKEEDEETLNKILEKVDSIESQVNILTASDMDDIRSWIVEKHRYYKKHTNENIDDFTMDCLEKRFSHYQDEGGNSYVRGLIEDLRKWSKEERE